MFSTYAEMKGSNPKYILKFKKYHHDVKIQHSGAVVKTSNFK